MDRSLFRYAPPLFLLFEFLSLLYFVYGFFKPGIFTFQTIALLLLATLMALLSFIVSLPRIESLFVEKFYESKVVYWAIIIVLFLIAGLFFLEGVASGGVDYTNYIAQNATG